MDNSTRRQIADLLTKLAASNEWDHQMWKRCHELIQANLDDELLDSFYRSFLTYPGLFNLRFVNSHPTKVSVMGVEANPGHLQELRKEFSRVSAALIEK